MKKMKKNTNRGLQWLFVIAICAGLLTFYSFADGTDTSLQSQINGAADGATLTLSEDYVISAPVVFPAGKTLTIDGGGFTIKRAPVYAGNLIEVSGTIAMQNVTVDGGADWGTIDSLTDANVNNGMTADDVMIRVNTDGSLTLDAGSIVQNNDKIVNNMTFRYGSAIVAEKNSSIVVNGGKICRNRIINNASTSIGGAAIHATDASVEIKSGDISYNAVYCSSQEGAEGGALRIYSTDGANATDKSILTMSGGTVTKNWSSYQAGAIMLVGYNTNFNMSGGEIIYNTASVMGAVNVNSHSHMNMTGGKICYNTATATISSAAEGFSGGIVGVTSGSEFIMSAGEICNNVSNSSASALDIYGKSAVDNQLSNATLTGTASIHDNYSDCHGTFNNAINFNKGGGAVVVHGDGILNIEGEAEIKSNSVSINSDCIDRSFGGGVLMLYGGSPSSGATVNMSGGTISGNKAGYGGGVAMNTLGVILTKSDKLKFNMTGGTISDNTSSDTTSRYAGGGGIYSRIGIVDISGGKIENNNAPNKIKNGGGGICMDYGSTLYFSGGSVSSNTSGRSGGGMYLGNYSGYSYITGGTISDNTVNLAAYYMSDPATGGGIWAYSKATYITDGVTITGNTAAFAGGIYAKDVNYPVYLLGGTVSDNTANKEYGNAIGVSGTLVLDGTNADVQDDIYLNTNRFVTLVNGADNDYELSTLPTDSANGRTVVAPLKNAFTFDGTNDQISNPISYNPLDSAEQYVEKFTHNIKSVTTGTLETTYTTDSGNLVLTEYKVSFDMNIPEEATEEPDPELIDPIYVKYNDYISSADDFPDTDPTLEGYLFLGWYTDSDLTTSLTDEDTMPKNDIILYAKWETAIKYDVIYDNNDINATGSQTDSDSPYKKDSTPVVLGEGDIVLKNAFFTGWNTEKNGTGMHYNAEDTLPAMSANVTLYAQWLKVEKTSAQGNPNDTLMPGEKINYTITVVIPEATTNLTVTDSIPVGTTYNNDANSNGSFDNGIITWNIGEATAGQTFTLTFSVKVKKDAKLGFTAENSAKVMIDNNNYDTNTVKDTICIVKTSALDPGNAELNRNENIYYTIMYYNATADTQTDVIISDEIPTETIYADGSVSEYGDASALTNGTGRLTWTIPSVQPGATVTVSFTVKTGRNTANNTIIVNKASVAAGNLSSISNETKDTLFYSGSGGPIIPITYTATLIKVDSKDINTRLAGATFELYKVYFNVDIKVGTFTTDANGIINVSGLSVGNYYWMEVGAPSGYKLDSSRHEFVLNSLGYNIVTVSNVHSDVPEWLNGVDHYAYIIGYTDGNVHPEANITRAEVATIFFRLLADDIRNQYITKSNSFSDVKENDWFCNAVSTLAKMGIVSGYPDGSFNPNGKITRAEFAAIAARFDLSGNTGVASFSDIYDHWAQKEIDIAANNGWVLGYLNGTFKPDQLITRAEAMTMVNRVLQRVPEVPSDLLNNMVKWPDNMDTDTWYYLAVQEATNSHEYNRKTNGYETWTRLRTVRDWTEFEK